MFKKLMFEQRVSVENSFNAFIYYLREIPFFEKHIPYEFFQHNRFKFILSIVTFIFGIVAKFVGRLLYSIGFMFLPYIILKILVVGNTYEYDEMIIHMFFVMSCICGSLVNTIILSSSDQDYMMLNILRVDPKAHYLGELLIKLVSDFIIFSLILMIFDMNPAEVLVLCAVMVACRCIGEMLSLMTYLYVPWLYSHKGKFDVTVIVVCFLMAYVYPLWIGDVVSMDIFLMNPVALGVLGVIGFICLILLITFRGYSTLARKSIKRVDREYSEQVLTRGRIATVIHTRKLTGNEALVTNRHDDKHGYVYLNYIFFDRFKKLLHATVNSKCIWVVLIAVATILYGMNGGQIAKSAIHGRILGLDTMWLVFFYIFSGSRKMCQTIFYNCDKEFLSYGYYRRKAAIQKMYLIRLWRCFLIDFRFIGTVMASVLFVNITLGYSWDLLNLLPILADIFLAGVCATVYHVSMYHLIQPYDATLQVKKIIFPFLGVIALIFDLIFLGLPLAGILCTTVYLLGTLAFTVFCSILVFEFGHYNFYLKK